MTAEREIFLIVFSPFTRGIMCSTENESGQNSSWLMQYSQHCLARVETNDRTAFPGRSLMFSIPGRSGNDTQLVHQRLQGHISESGELDQQGYSAGVIGFNRVDEPLKFAVIFTA